MSPLTDPRQILIVTGMSGAGKTTALQTLEDLGWETVDNLPLGLLSRLLATPAVAAGTPGEEAGRPLAIGIDSRTRDFDSVHIIAQVHAIRAEYGAESGLLFLDCSGTELSRRYSETRRVHPLATDRPVTDGIAREREILAPLRRAATYLVDTTDYRPTDLRAALRDRFGVGSEGLLVTFMSFAFSRGVPRNADLLFDVRFLRNPYWQPELKALGGLDQAVADYIAADPAYPEALERLEGLLLFLLPRYATADKAYVTVAFGCTGGQHRSVHVCEAIAQRVRSGGHPCTVKHRDLERALEHARERQAGNMVDRGH